MLPSPRLSNNGVCSSIQFLRKAYSTSSSSSSSTAAPTTTTFEDELDNTNQNNEALQPSAKISVDCSGLYNPPEHSHEPSPASELVRHLKGIINFRGGPIYVADYMEKVLTNHKAGFYINRDIFGSEGDFVTSPEVSQMFGEGMSKFENFTKTLYVYMVECSPALWNLQYQTLKCADEDASGSESDKRVVSMLVFRSHGIQHWSKFLREVHDGNLIEGCEEEEKEETPFIFDFLHMQIYMKWFKWAIKDDIAKLEYVEVCPKGMESTHAIAKRIGSDGGCALIIDYGLNGVVSDNLQAIRKHKFVDVLDNPGTADLSAYVDFASRRHSAEEASVLEILVDLKTITTKEVEKGTGTLHECIYSQYGALLLLSKL